MSNNPALVAALERLREQVKVCNQRGYVTTLNTRADDVLLALGEISTLRQTVSESLARIDELQPERDSLKIEVSELRKSVATAISTLENAACAAC